MGRKLTIQVLLSAGCLLGCEPLATQNNYEPPPGTEAIAQVDGCTLPAMPPASTTTFRLDVPYDSSDGKPITVDLAWPTATSAPGKRPIVIFVHGGAWREGSPHEYLDDIVKLAGQGYVAASVGYRLVPQVKFPVPVGDVSCAIRFVRLASIELGGDTSRVMLVGTSAGAQIAALQGLNPDANYDASCPHRNLAGNRVQGVIAISGAFDLTRSNDFSTTTLREIANFLGGTASSLPAVAMAASPVFQISPDDPPVLLVHGTADNVTPLRQSQQMMTALRQGGVPSTLVEVKRANHDITLFDTAGSRQSSSCTMWAFIRKQLSE